MKSHVLILPALLALAVPAMAQEVTPNSAPQAPVVPLDAPPPEGSTAQALQHLREHQRAVASGDHANDPLNSSSADFLNRRELDKALSQGNGPSYYSENIMPRNTPVEGLPPVSDNSSIESITPDPNDGTVDSPPPPEGTPTGQVPPIPQPVTPDEDPLSPNSGIR